jgi:uncharacterized protein (DUF2164 family)
MSIELTREVRQEAVASIERYFREHMDEKTGNIAAGGLLSFFLEEIGPSIYNGDRNFNGDRKFNRMSPSIAQFCGC